MTAMTALQAEILYVYTQKNTLVYIYNTEFLQFCSILFTDSLTRIGKIYTPDCIYSERCLYKAEINRKMKK